MKRKLILMLILISAIGFTLNSTPAPVKASGNDCGVVGQVCRDISNMIYDMCIVSGGAADSCAYQEAVNTINCIKDSGCPLHD